MKTRTNKPKGLEEIRQDIKKYKRRGAFCFLTAIASTALVAGSAFYMDAKVSKTPELYTKKAQTQETAEYLQDYKNRLENPTGGEDNPDLTRALSFVHNSKSYEELTKIVDKEIVRAKQRTEQISRKINSSPQVQDYEQKKASLRKTSQKINYALIGMLVASAAGLGIYDQKRRDSELDYNLITDQTSGFILTKN